MVVSVTPKSALVSDDFSVCLNACVDFVMARNNEIGEGFTAMAKCSLVLTKVADENRVCWWSADWSDARAGCWQINFNVSALVLYA